MKNIVFIAPPAAGKGTQSELLVSKYGYVHISTGDLLREEIIKQSPLGIEIENLMQSGALVSNEIVTKLLQNALSEIDKPFILDGYPRNIEQVDLLDNILKVTNKSIDAVVYLDVSYNTLLERVLGRLNCPNCLINYHKVFAKPKNENVCDRCNIQLVSRTDDNEETFKNRYDTFLRSTKPLLDIYQDRELLVKIYNDCSSLEVFNEIEKVIK